MSDGPNGWLSIITDLKDFKEFFYILYKIKYDELLHTVAHYNNLNNNTRSVM